MHEFVESMYKVSEKNPMEKMGENLKQTFKCLIKKLTSIDVDFCGTEFVELSNLIIINRRNFSVDSLFSICRELEEESRHNNEYYEIAIIRNIHVAGAIVMSKFYFYCNNEDDKKKVLDVLSNIRDDPILDTLSYKYLSNLMAKIDVTEFKIHVFPFIESKLTKPWEEHTIDTLYMLMDVEEKFPEVVSAHFLENHLGTKQIVCPESLDFFSHIMKNIVNPSNLRHSIFCMFSEKIFVSHLAEQFLVKLGHVMNFDFGQYLTYTQLLTGVLSHGAKPEMIFNVLTYFYIERTVLMNRQGYESDDFEFVKGNFFDEVVESLQKNQIDSKIVIGFLRKFLSTRLISHVFENIANCWIILQLVKFLNVRGIREMIEILKKALTGNEVSMGAKVFVAELLIESINHNQLSGEDYWKVQQLIFLGRLCVMKSEEMPEESANLFEKVFCQSIMNMGVLKLHCLETIFSTIFNEFVVVIDKGNYDILRAPLTAEDHDIWKKMVAIITELDESSLDKDIIIRNLCLWCAFMLLCGSHFPSYFLSEIFSCCESITDSTETETVWLEIVDLFLNLLSYVDFCTPCIVTSLFPIACKYINSSILHQILYVLDPSNQNIRIPHPEEEEQEEDIDNREDVENYKHKVLELIKMYLNHKPGMLETLEIMSQLMRLLEFSLKTDTRQGFVQDVKECLNHLPSLEIGDSSEVTEAFLVQLLTETIHREQLEPAIVEEMSEHINDFCIFLLKCSERLDPANVATSKAKISLNIFMSYVIKSTFTRKSTLSPNLLVEVFQSRWKHIHTFALLPQVFHYVFKKCDSTRRNLALKLVKLFFKDCQYIDSHIKEMKLIKGHIVRFLAGSLDFFRRSTQRQDKIDEEFLACADDLYFGQDSTKDEQKTAKIEFICDLFETLYNIRDTFIRRKFQAWNKLELEIRHYYTSTQLLLPPDILAKFKKICHEGAVKSIDKVSIEWQ